MPQPRSARTDSITACRTIKLALPLAASLPVNLKIRHEATFVLNNLLPSYWQPHDVFHDPFSARVTVLPRVPHRFGQLTRIAIVEIKQMWDVAPYALILSYLIYIGACLPVATLAYHARALNQSLIVFWIAPTLQSDMPDPQSMRAALQLTWISCCTTKPSVSVPSRTPTHRPWSVLPVPSRYPPSGLRGTRCAVYTNSGTA
jgi:hypothetical protein